MNRQLRANAKKMNLAELHESLNKVLMFQTLGIDVSQLFPEMCILSQTNDLLSKKMIYMFLATSAESNPEQALMIVNTFMKEQFNQDPKLRSLGLRCLSQITSQLSTEMVQQHFIKNLEDRHPSVQCTAMLGLLKIHYVDKAFIDDHGLLDKMYNLLRSAHPAVVSTAISVLNEVLAEEGGMAVNGKIVKYLLGRLKEFNSYSATQVILLLRKYEPRDKEELLSIMNLLDSKFKYSNTSLTLEIIKTFILYCKGDSVLHQDVLTRSKETLLTLLMSTTDELRFNVLVNIDSLTLIGGKKVFEKDFKRFFCEADDKDYIKKVRIQILQKMITSESFDEIFNELWLAN